jgi:acyl CoA:acetate/3-ketoacid CoA transferase alpha subunit
MSLAEAVEAAVRDDDTVAMEGFTHLIPHAAGHEIIRQGRKRLTLIRMTPDLIYDQMIGMGCAEKVVFSWGGNPGVGSLHRFRDAYENGWPCPARSCAATSAPTCPRSIRTSGTSPARSRARSLPRCRRSGPMWESCTRRRPTAPAT